MHHKGEATFSGYTVRPDKDAAEEMYNMDSTGDNYPIWADTNGKELERMPMADWLSLAVLRSHESSTWTIPIIVKRFPPFFTLISKKMIYNGERENTIDQLSAVNWPDMMERLCRDFLGFQNVESVGLSINSLERRKSILSIRRYDEQSNDDLYSLLKMEKAHKEGATVLMMIDSQMFDDIVSYSYNDLLTQSHWIVCEGGLIFYNAANKPVKEIGKATKLVFKFATWGKDPLKSSSLLKYGVITSECFKSTFYGYVVCHNTLNKAK